MFYSFYTFLFVRQDLLTRFHTHYMGILIFSTRFLNIRLKSSILVGTQTALDLAAHEYKISYWRFSTLSYAMPSNFFPSNMYKILPNLFKGLYLDLHLKFSLSFAWYFYYPYLCRTLNFWFSLHFTVKLRPCYNDRPKLFMESDVINFLHISST